MQKIKFTENVETLRKEGIALMRDYMLLRKIFTIYVQETAKNFHNDNQKEFLDETNKLLTKNDIPPLTFEEDNGK